MVYFVYGAPKTCQIFKVLVVLPCHPLEKFLRAPMCGANISYVYDGRTVTISDSSTLTELL